MSTEADIKAVADTIAALEPVAKKVLPQGPLTRDERRALQVAAAIVDTAVTFGTGHDATADAVLGLLTQVPRLAELALGFFATMRMVVAKVDQLTVEIGDLGPGVEVTG